MDYDKYNLFRSEVIAEKTLPKTKNTTSHSSSTQCLVRRVTEASRLQQPRLSFLEVPREATGPQNETAQAVSSQREHSTLSEISRPLVTCGKRLTNLILLVNT